MPPETNDRQAEPKFAPDARMRLDSERAVWREVGDEIVILDVPTATYLTLNSSAVTLWKQLEGGASPAELAAESWPCTRSAQRRRPVTSSAFLARFRSGR